MKGSKVNNQTGVYGTQGLTSQLNIAGARDFGVGRASSPDVFYFIGGYGWGDSVGGGDLNDLWRIEVVHTADAAMWTLY